MNIRKSLIYRGEKEHFTKNFFLARMDRQIRDSPGRTTLFLLGHLTPMSSQTTIFVILSAAKNLSVEAAEILHSATLRSE
jgi:hypothetical protein